jgi:hypothetical protein
VCLKGLYWAFLFLLYINDINTDIVNQIRLFADDTSLFVVVNNDIINSAKSLTSDLERIKSWSEQWAVNFNANKTVNVDFTRKQYLTLLSNLVLKVNRLGNAIHILI